MLKIINNKYNLNEKGQGLVEYAIVLPIFLMLVFMIIDYSTVLYNKLSFNTALRDSIFKIEFNEWESAELQKHLNPFGPTGWQEERDPYGNVTHVYRENRYANPNYLEVEQKRGHDFYIDQNFLGGVTTGEYLKNEIKKRDPSIDIDNITFSDFEENRKSRIGIYSGLQHYHYKKSYGEDDRNYQYNPKFSTIIVAMIRVNYKIETSGFFTKNLYPNGVDHEKVIYKVSRSIRWEPVIENPKEADPLDRR